MKLQMKIKGLEQPTLIHRRKEKRVRVEIGVVLILVVGVLVMGSPGVSGAVAEPVVSNWITSTINVPRLEQHVFDSKVVNAKVSYYMYTPEMYDVNKEQRFPVVYWLHGGGGGVKHLPKAVKHFDDAIRSGKLPPVIVVFPHGMAMSNWCNSKDGKVPMETVVIHELIPYVDATFRTIPDRKGRLVEGFSMGGYGAARFGFKFHDLFGAISIFAGGPLQQELTETDGPVQNAKARVAVMQSVYGNDQNYFKEQSPWVLAETNADAVKARRPKLRIVVGSDDFLLAMNQEFSGHLSKLGIAHEVQVLPGVGHHQLAVFDALGNANWNFYRAFLGVNPVPVSTQDEQGPTSPRRPNAEMADQRNDKFDYDKFVERVQQFDHDGDGIIHIDDLPPKARKRAQQIDKNQDGKIDRSELSDF